jgi:L-lactate utilization protein LutB
MADLDKLKKNLEDRGYGTAFFSTAKEAADYLDTRLDGAVIAFGGSVTLQEMGLYERLAAHNTVYWHWKDGTKQQARGAQVYLSSVNGVAETGELVNIDGDGNRISSTLFGPEKVYLVVGINKITPDYDSALWRARNVAGPKNAQRLRRKTPCAVRADKCYDCKSPERICRALTVFWEKPTGIPETELVVVSENLGY